MNKKLIQNILYAGHCIGICSDWSEQAVDRIIDTLKECVYNENIIDEDKLDELATESMKKSIFNDPNKNDCGCDTAYYYGFVEGYRKAMED